MKYFYNILFFFLISCLGNTALAQEQVQAMLDSTTIMLGDELALRLRIVNAENISNPTVDLNPLKGVAEIEIKHEFDWDTLDIMGNRVLEKEITLTSWDSGYYFIPSLVINYKKKGTNVSRPTNKLAVSVNTMQTDPMTIAPNKGIEREPLKLQDFWGLIAGLIALGVVVAGFYYYRKYHNKDIDNTPWIAPKPAHEIALLKLRDLKEAKLWQQGKIKAYQSQLTYIVREYLENRYEIQALEQTSDQILRSMKAKNIEQKYRDELHKMFTMADLVKFAKAKPPVDVNEQLMQYSEAFVRQTKKEPIVEQVEKK